MNRAKPVDRPEHDALRELIARWRQEAGLSQRELSARLGRSHNYIVKIESGVSGVEVVEFIDIIRALGQDLRLALAAYCEVLERS